MLLVTALWYLLERYLEDPSASCCTRPPNTAALYTIYYTRIFIPRAFCQHYYIKLCGWWVGIWLFRFHHVHITYEALPSTYIWYDVSCALVSRVLRLMFTSDLLFYCCVVVVSNQWIGRRGYNTAVLTAMEGKLANLRHFFCQEKLLSVQYPAAHWVTHVTCTVWASREQKSMNPWSCSELKKKWERPNNLFFVIITNTWKKNTWGRLLLLSRRGPCVYMYSSSGNVQQSFVAPSILSGSPRQIDNIVFAIDRELPTCIDQFWGKVPHAHLDQWFLRRCGPATSAKCFNSKKLSPHIFAPWGLGYLFTLYG